jgi:hypothetical protein
MIKLDISILDEMGFSDISEADKKQLYGTFVEKLELNVGTILSQQMDDQQLADFMKLVDSGDQEAAKQWLEENMPKYKEVVSEELEKLKKELTDNAQAIKESLNT